MRHELQQINVAEEVKKEWKRRKGNHLRLIIRSYRTREKVTERRVRSASTKEKVEKRREWLRFKLMGEHNPQSNVHIFAGVMLARVHYNGYAHINKNVRRFASFAEICL